MTKQKDALSHVNKSVGRSIADERPIAMLLFLVMVSGLGPLIIIELISWLCG